MTDFFPVEKGTPIRNPSSANFLISSKDRTTFDLSGGNACDFQITKTNSLLNGFFTRIAPNEVVLDWCIDNVSSYWNNNLIYVDISGAPPTQKSYLVPSGQYTVKQVLDLIVAGLSTGGYTFSLSTTTSGLQAISATSGGSPVTFKFKSVSNSGINVANLPTQLNLKLDTYGVSFAVDCPKLLPTQYIDFVSPGLTYNQEVKDGSTSLKTTDILFRWYFAWDTPEPTDAYGYPIYQGYKRFVQRREIPFPKQIRWSANQPIGNLAFQVLDDEGNILNPNLAVGEVEWFMTLLASEV